MSVPNILTGIPQFDQLQQLETKRVELQGMLDEGQLASETVKTALERGVSLTDQRIGEIIGDPEVQSLVHGIGAKATEALSQLEPLEGVLPEEELAEIRNVEQAKLDGVQAFFERYGKAGEQTPEAQKQQAAGGVAVAATTEPKPGILDDPEAADGQGDKGEALKTSVAITIKNRVLEIGNQGKIVLFAGNRHDGQRDYTNERRTALMYLVDRQGEEVSPYDIWEAIYDDGRPFDRKVMSNIRGWLDSVTFRRKPIVTFNGKRGASSRYMVDPAFDVSIKDLRKPESEAVAAPEVPSTDVEDEPVAIEKPSRHIEFGDGLVIDSADLYITSGKLASLSEVLYSNGKLAPGQEILQGLLEYKPDLSHLNNDEALFTHREQALERIQAILDDHDAFLALVDGLPEGSPQLAFVEYISEQMEAEEDWLLIKRLLTARWQHDTTLYKGIPESIKKVLVDKHDRIIWPEVEAIEYGTTQPVGIQAVRQAVAESEGDNVDVDELDPISSDGVDEQNPPQGGVRKARRGRRNGKRKAKGGDQMAAFELEAERLAQEFVDAGFDLDGLYTMAAINNRFHTFERRIMSLDKDKGGASYASEIHDERPVYALRDFVRINLAAGKQTANLANMRAKKGQVDNAIDRAAKSVSQPNPTKS